MAVLSPTGFAVFNDASIAPVRLNAAHVTQRRLATILGDRQGGGGGVEKIHDAGQIVVDSRRRNFGKLDVLCAMDAPEGEFA